MIIEQSAPPKSKDYPGPRAAAALRKMQRIGTPEHVSQEALRDAIEARKAIMKWLRECAPAAQEAATFSKAEQFATRHMFALMLMTLEALTAKCEALEAELKQLRGTHGLKYRGVWQPGEYAAGSMVTRHGSIWHADRTTTSAPGDGTSDWTLAVKAGRNGRGSRK